MNKLLKHALDAHGGLERFNSFETVSATFVAGGDFWATKKIEIDAFVRQIRPGKTRKAS